MQEFCLAAVFLAEKQGFLDAESFPQGKTMVY